MAKNSKIFKSYLLAHKANTNKSLALFNLYDIYKKEYKVYTQHYWKDFLFDNVKYKNFSQKLQKYSFSHLGSTKHITTQLNSSYLQICLSTSCSTLNSYLASIEHKFSNIINKSSLHNDKEVLHQLRYINLCHAYNKKFFVYYPTITKTITDDFGNVINITEKVETFIPIDTLKLAKRIFKHIVQQRVKFPDLSKPSLILDSRVSEVLTNETSKSFDYWLKVSTLNKGKTVLIPLQTNEHYEKVLGKKGNTVALNFKFYNYAKETYKRRSLRISGSRTKRKCVKQVKQEFKVVFNKKIDFNDIKIFHNVDEQLTKQASRKIAFDIGLSTLLASSEGQLLGQRWLGKLRQYDEKITELAKQRQKLGLKTRSRRYDGLIKKIRGFIKSESNRILNSYFEKAYHQGNYIKEVVIEKLYFNNPSLSKKLNRIIKNFGLKHIKDKLSELSEIYGFELIEINPAYSSQVCNSCGYVDEKNRVCQKLFKCLCCKVEKQADVHASRNINGRSVDKNFDYVSCTKVAVLAELKRKFVKNIRTLISRGVISRRSLEKLLLKNSYFKDFVCTT